MGVIVGRQFITCQSNQNQKIAFAERLFFDWNRDFFFSFKPLHSFDLQLLQSNYLNMLISLVHIWRNTAKGRGVLAISNQTVLRSVYVSWVATVFAMQLNWQLSIDSKVVVRKCTFYSKLSFSRINRFMNMSVSSNFSSLCLCSNLQLRPVFSIIVCRVNWNR